MICHDYAVLDREASIVMVEPVYTTRSKLNVSVTDLLYTSWTCRAVSRSASLARGRVADKESRLESSGDHGFGPRGPAALLASERRSICFQCRPRGSPISESESYRQGEFESSTP